jgi:hypothetical protein
LPGVFASVLLFRHPGNNLTGRLIAFRYWHEFAGRRAASVTQRL